jgi:Uma2 family endonuclease
MRRWRPCADVGESTVTTVPARYTRADYERLPEGFPAQLVDGSLVKDPSPLYGHQDAVVRVYEALRRLLPLRRIKLGPVDVPIDEFNVYQPDVAVYASPLPPEERGTRVPALVFEVLSPGTARRDRTFKRERYLDAGVTEVWILDREARTIEVFDGQGVRRAGEEESLPSRALPGFALSPAQAFDDED